VPKLGFLCLLADNKVFEARDLILELDDEPDFGRYAEVADCEEADGLQECKSVQLLLISPECDQVFELDLCNLHYIADVE